MPSTKESNSAGRVIAGTAKGRALVSPGEGTRPLGDRVKQTLFAILEPELDGGLWVIIKMFAAGLLYDCAAFSYAGAALALYLLVLPEKVYAPTVIGVGFCQLIKKSIV